MGAILVTTFHNPWRVLVRFDLGDVVRLAEEPCPCGRCEGITLASIEGRGINCTLDVQGAAVTQAEVDRRMAGLDGLEDYQLVQEGPALYVLRVVCPENKGDAIVAAAISRLTALYGEGAEVQVNRVENLPPDPPGKFRLCKPLFPLDTRTFR